MIKITEQDLVLDEIAEATAKRIARYLHDAKKQSDDMNLGTITPWIGVGVFKQFILTALTEAELRKLAISEQADGHA